MLVIPSDEVDFTPVFHLARAYFQSSEIIKIEENSDNLLLHFPAYTTAAFALELYLKGFRMLSDSKNGKVLVKYPHGHKIMDQWDQISDELKKMIIGMFRNPSNAPRPSGYQTILPIFEKQLQALGLEPFKETRYIYEKASGMDKNQARFMPINPLREILFSLDATFSYLSDSSTYDK